MKLKLLSIALLAVLVTNSAMAEKVVLNFRNKTFTGQSTLFLKQKLKQQHPHMCLKNAELRKAVLVAQTRQGRGRAKLKIGNEISAPQIVSTYMDRYPFRNPSWNSRGVWQFKLKGKFRVKKVVLRLRTDDYACNNDWDNGNGWDDGDDWDDAGPARKRCTYVLETAWGEDIREFTSTGQTKRQACMKARQRCKRRENGGDVREALLKCTRK